MAQELTRHMIACVALGVVPALHFLLVASEKELGDRMRLKCLQMRRLGRRSLRVIMLHNSRIHSMFSLRRLLRAWQAASGS